MEKTAETKTHEERFDSTSTSLLKPYHPPRLEEHGQGKDLVLTNNLIAVEDTYPYDGS